MITIFGVVSYTLYDHWKEQLLFCIPNKIFQNASCPSHNHFCGHLSGKLCCRQKERLSPSASYTCKLLQVSKTRWPFYFAWKLGKLDKILSRKKWKKEQPMAREEAARRMGRGAVPILRAASLLVNLSYNVFQRAKKKLQTPPRKENGLGSSGALRRKSFYMQTRSLWFKRKIRTAFGVTPRRCVLQDVSRIWPVESKYNYF